MTRQAERRNRNGNRNDEAMIKATRRKNEKDFNDDGKDDDDDD